MSTFLLIEGVNLFCGTDDPDASKHLTLAELALPTLTETYEDHNPGGGRVGVEMPVGIEKLNATFKLNGYDPSLMTQFGLYRRTHMNYTGLASIQDRKTGSSYQAKTVMRGRLGAVTPDTFQRGSLAGHEYGIMGLTHFSLHYDGVEKLFFDLFTNAWRVDGVDQNDALNRNLGLA